MAHGTTSFTRISRPLAILALAGTFLSAAGPASAQSGMVVSSVGSPAGGPNAVSRSAFEKYAQILKLDDTQKEAGKALHEAYQTSSREAQKKLQDDLKAAQADLKDGDMAASMQKIPAIIEKHGEASGKLSKQFLDDLKSILTTAQTEQGWPKLERYRRRAAWLRMGPVSGSAVDLTEVVAKMQLPADLSTKLQGPLDQYELDIDRALVEREQFETDDAAKMPKAGMGLFDTDAMDKRMKFDRENATKVRDINRTYQRQLGALLPDAERAKLDQQFQAASFKTIYRPTHTAKTLQAAEKFDDLTAAQRDQLKVIQETYAREIKAANDRWAAAQERAETDGKAHAFPVLHIASGADDMTPPDLKEARTARRELEKRTADQLAQVLTDEQKARLPQRSETTARGGGGGGRIGFRTGTRVMAHDDGSGNSAVVVVATEDDGPMMIDDESEEESEEGDMVFRQVIIHSDQEVTTPAPAPDAPATPPQSSPQPK